MNVWGQEGRARRTKTREPIAPPGWQDLEIQEAYRNWMQQQEFFQQATDPAAIDQAIELCQEAEQIYRQCLKRIREHSGF